MGTFNISFLSKDIPETKRNENTVSNQGYEMHTVSYFHKFAYSKDFDKIFPPKYYLFKTVSSNIKCLLQKSLKS